MVCVLQARKGHGNCTIRGRKSTLSNLVSKVTRRRPLSRSNRHSTWPSRLPLSLFNPFPFCAPLGGFCCLWGLLAAVEQTHLDAKAGGSGHPEEFACCTAAPCLCMILFSLFSLRVTCLLFRLEVSATSQTKLSLRLGVCLLMSSRRMSMSMSGAQVIPKCSHAAALLHVCA